MTNEWLAGLLEGEGCFTTRRMMKGKPYCYPTISIAMTDRDVVENVASMWGKNTSSRQRPPFKTVYETAVTGLHALPVMLSVFPLMGERRRKRIIEILSAWEHQYFLGGPNG